MGSMTEKVALVTGGASGIGRATALRFAGEGAKVVIADIDVEGGAESVQMIKANGGESVCIRTDVTQAASVSALVAEVIAAYGRLDYAFNNAGIAGGGLPAAELTEETWDRVIGVNLKGVWLCMKYELQQMLNQGGGAIVNTASIIGLIATGTATA
jgi:NAD(P)-dependent dehydrogenase (short-subunit alcohol dehydrogenase family)